MYTRSNTQSIFLCLTALVFFSCTSTPTVPENNLTALVKARDLNGIKAHFKSDDIKIKDESGLSLLHIAVLQNDPDITAYLLDMGAEIEEHDPLGRTPLTAAAAESSFAAARVLARYNALLFASDAEGLTPFQILLEKRKLTAVLNEQTVLQKDSSGRSVLHHAVHLLDSALTAEILTAAGPYAGQIAQERDEEGRTPLENAYSRPEQKEAAVIADMLLRAGAEPLRGTFSAFETAAMQHNYTLRFEQGRTVLHIEAAAGHTGFVLFLLEKKISADIKDSTQAAPLHEAVRNGHTAAASALLAAGADPAAAAAFGNTALHLAVTSPARAELVPVLLKHGAAPSVKDEYGETPLHTAVRIGAEPEIIGTLLQAGADVNERNKKGETPLLLAVERDLHAQSEVLIRAGADIHREDTQKRTPFVEAVRRHQPLIPVLVTGSTARQYDSKGRTVLHLAILLNADTGLITYLIEQNTGVNTADKAGNTPLHYAVSNNQPEIGGLLIKSGADIFTTNKQGESPVKLAFTKQNGRELWLVTPETVRSTDSGGSTILHYAAVWGNTALIPLIIQQGGNSNAQNYKGETPLFSAVQADNREAVRFLFETDSQTDSRARDFLGNTVLHTAISWRSAGAAEEILQKSPEPAALLNEKNSAGKTPLHIAAQQGDIPFLNLFLTYGADINADDREGKTPLTNAVLHGKNSTVLFLLQHGADPARQDVQGRTVLHEAVGITPPQLITALIRAGADPLSRDSYGNTPLARAFRTERPVLDALLGSNTALTNSDGETPLHIAVQEGIDEETAEYLIAKGFPLNKRNRTGTTALTLAAQQGNVRLCSLLIHRGADIFAANSSGNSAASIALTRNTALLPLLQHPNAVKTDAAGNSLLHYAARYASAETVRQLLNTDSTGTAAKNTAGETPADIAVRRERPEIAELLRTKESAQ
ncbi:MAG: ankyrin repeat domain-containing protein [Treponema sp.]